MPEFSTIALLALAAFSMQLIPGPDMMLVTARGIGQGYRFAQMTALGVALAGIIQIPLLAFGISELVTENPVILDSIRILGAAYLIFLGFRLILRRGSIEPTTNIFQTSLKQAVADGAIANLLNPKVIIFQLAFLPQFVDIQSGPVWSQLFILGLVMKFSGLLVMSIVAFTSAALAHYLKNNIIWMTIQEKITGVILISIGVKLLFEHDVDDRPISV